MPIRDDEKRRAYFREYMRKRRTGTPTDAEATDELARQVRDTWQRLEASKEKMDHTNAELIKLAEELLPHFEQLLAEHEALVKKYNELVTDYNELLDDFNELLDEPEAEPGSL